MNKKIRKVIEKNRYRSSFYQNTKNKKKKTNKETNMNHLDQIKHNDKSKYHYLFSFLNKVLFSIMILIVLLISKKDEKFSVFYKETFKNMNIVKIEDFITKRFSGIFPAPEDEYKYVNAPVIDFTNTTNYKDGVIVELSLGAPVQSSVEGRVVRFYNDNDLGKVVVIQDISGYEYHYGYLDAINVKLYEKIEYGKTLGIGESNDNLDTYFYLAIKDNDLSLDVLNVLYDLQNLGF